MKIVHAKTDANGKPGFENSITEDDEDAIEEEIADTDLGEDGQQDGSTIEVDNNIVNHLIAECQNCHGIFISAMIASDQAVESINGVCPLCNKDTEQFLYWSIKEYPETSMDIMRKL